MMHFLSFIGLSVFNERRSSMIEQLKIQAEASLTDGFDRAHSHAADQTLEDANRTADLY